MKNVTVNIFPKNRKLFYFGLISLFFFALMTLLETQRLFYNFDFWATKSLQTIVPRILDVPLSVFSLLGSFEVTVVFVIALTFLALKRGGIIPYLFILFGFLNVFELMGKIWLFHPNPPHNFFRYDIPFNFPSVYVQTGYSYPSGHVSRTLFLMVALIVFFRKRALTIFCFSFAVIMILSRVYLGEHWASDTIGGLFLGGAMGLIASSYL